VREGQLIWGGFESELSNHAVQSCKLPAKSIGPPPKFRNDPAFMLLRMVWPKQRFYPFSCYQRYKLRDQYRGIVTNQISRRSANQVHLNVDGLVQQG
jgi:hypothetical protein